MDPHEIERFRRRKAVEDFTFRLLGNSLTVGGILTPLVAILEAQTGATSWATQVVVYGVAVTLFLLGNNLRICGGRRSFFDPPWKV